MRPTSLSSRTLVLASVTALLAGGVSGALLTPAAAVGPSPTITRITPDAAGNTSTVNFTISGTNFVPAADRVFLVPTFPGTEVGEIEADIDPTSTPTTLQVSAALNRAAPGGYELRLEQQNVPTQVVNGCLDKSPCLNVISLGAATVNGVARGVTPAFGTDRGSGALDITGNNFAKGARVEFLLPGTCAADDKITFVPNNPNNDPETGYPTSTRIEGNYTASTGFIPGLHHLRVKNTDGKIVSSDCTVGTTPFYLPFFTADGISPNRRGRGSTNQVVTVTGSGFRQGSTLSISNLGTLTTGDDIHVGTATVSPDGTTISAPVSLEDFASTAARTVTVSGPDGARLAVADGFRATAAPEISELSHTAVGRGGTLPLTISGTGFVGGDHPTTFSFGGNGVTAETVSVAGSTSALVTVRAAADATLGGRSVTATNPDGGASTLGPNDLDVYPFEVNPAPIATNVSPFSSGKGTSRTMVITGDDFNASMDVTFSGTGVSRTSGVTVTQGAETPGMAPEPDTATFSISVAGDAAAGLRDIVLKNNNDFGSSTCAGCFGVDDLAVSPGADANTNPASTLTFTGEGFSSGSVAKLIRAGDATDVLTAALTPTGATTGTATFNLVNAAPGRYNATVTTGGVTRSCSSCFSVVGTQPTITGIDPEAAGQGATGFEVSITGTNFSRGMRVEIEDVTVREVSFVSSTVLTAVLDVPAAAPTGAKDVTVENADGSFEPAVLAGAFTVNPKPDVKSVSPAALGQGATNQTITVTASGLQTSSTLSLGSGITVTNVSVTQGSDPLNPNPDDTMTAKVTIAGNAATGDRAVTIDNPDGGTTTETGLFAVNAGPKVDAVSPPSLQPGAQGASLTITGDNFASNAQPVIANVSFTSTTVAADGKSITGTVNVDANAPRGARTVSVVNQTDKGAGSCSSCFTIGALPGAPTITKVVFSGSTATVTWTAPADNGGSTITGYVASANNNGAPVTVSGDKRSAILSGFTVNSTYTFSVVAQNAAGTGPAGTKTATYTLRATRLTSTRSPATPVAGAATIYTGRLSRVADNSPVISARITLTLDPDIGGTRIVTVTTGSTGTWTLRFNPVYNTTVSARFAGDVDDAAVSAARYRHGVAPRITRTSPASGATSSAGSLLVVRGSIYPNKAGRTIGLYEGSTLIGRATVASNGTFAISVRPGRGTHTLRIGMGATSGNVAGFSTAFVVRRV